MELPRIWTTPTPELLAEIVRRTKGRGGSFEDEAGVNINNGDDWILFSSSIGAETARICERNPDAILAVRCVEHTEGLTVWFRIDKGAVLRLGTIIAPPRSLKQQEADRARGLALAALRNDDGEE